MTATDELLRNAAAYAAAFEDVDLPQKPERKVAVLACMDGRLDVHRLLGLAEGDAHVIRNAGGVVTEHEIRALSISQHVLGTEEVILIHHTGCGMLGFDDAGFKARLLEATGVDPAWTEEGFGDLDEDVRQSVGRVKASPFILHKHSVRGFVYDVHTGGLREVV
jgi:carbonic anhydrase